MLGLCKYECDMEGVEVWSHSSLLHRYLQQMLNTDALNLTSENLKRGSVLLAFHGTPFDAATLPATSYITR